MTGAVILNGLTDTQPISGQRSHFIPLENTIDQKWVKVGFAKCFSITFFCLTKTRTFIDKLMCYNFNSFLFQETVSFHSKIWQSKDFSI